MMFVFQYGCERSAVMATVALASECRGLMEVYRISGQLRSSGTYNHSGGYLWGGRDVGDE